MRQQHCILVLFLHCSFSFFQTEASELAFATWLTVANFNVYVNFYLSATSQASAIYFTAFTKGMAVCQQPCPTPFRTNTSLAVTCQRYAYGLLGSAGVEEAEIPC